MWSFLLWFCLVCILKTPLFMKSKEDIFDLLEDGCKCIIIQQQQYYPFQFTPGNFIGLGKLEHVKPCVWFPLPSITFSGWGLGSMTCKILPVTFERKLPSIRISAPEQQPQAIKLVLWTRQFSQLLESAWPGPVQTEQPTSCFSQSGIPISRVPPYSFWGRAAWGLGIASLQRQPGPLVACIQIRKQCALLWGGKGQFREGFCGKQAAAEMNSAHPAHISSSKEIIILFHCLKSGAGHECEGSPLSGLEPPPPGKSVPHVDPA